VKISNITINRNRKRDRRTWSYNVKIELITEGENLDALKRISADDNCAYTWTFGDGAINISFVGDVGEESLDQLFGRFEAKLYTITKLAKGQALIDDVAKIIQ
jgi:hypothetical protein